MPVPPVTELCTVPDADPDEALFEPVTEALPLLLLLWLLLPLLLAVWVADADADVCSDADAEADPDADCAIQRVSLLTAASSFNTAHFVVTASFASP